MNRHDRRKWAKEQCVIRAKLRCAHCNGKVRDAGNMEHAVQFWCLRCRSLQVRMKDPATELGPLLPR